MASRWRAAAAVAVGCCLIAGACGGGAEDPEVADDERASSTTAAPGDAPGEAAVEVPPALTVDGAPAPLETKPAPPLAVAPAPASGTGSPAPGEDEESTQPYRPGPGSYRYEGDNGGEKVASTIKYEDIGPDPAGFRLRQTSLDPDGFGQVREVLWSAEGVRVDRQHNTSPDGESGRCDWRPDLVQYVFPIDVGRRWEASTTCYSTDPARPGTLAQKSSVRVTDRRRVTVAGVTTTVFVLEREGSTTLGAAGVTVVRRRRSTELWSPRYGLVVEESGTTSTETPGEDRPPAPFRYKLLDLRPR